MVCFLFQFVENYEKLEVLQAKQTSAKKGGWGVKLLEHLN